MGLDIYVGPLCRYYAGNWQTIIQQWGQPAAAPVATTHPQPSALRKLWQRLRPATSRATADPVQAIHAWREALHQQGLFPADTDWDWPESTDMEYETDKPDYRGYGAVQLWAAYIDRPNLQRPADLSASWENDPALKAVSESPSAQVSHIIGPELWLPIQFDQLVEAAEPTGGHCSMGSVYTLHQQLRRLNELTWNASEDEIARWQLEELDSNSLDATARWGFSIWSRLTDYAVQHRLPMRLDY